MAYVFYALGAFAILVGIVWTGTVLSAPADTTNGPTGREIARFEFGFRHQEGDDS